MARQIMPCGPRGFTLKAKQEINLVKHPHRKDEIKVKVAAPARDNGVLVLSGIVVVLVVVLLIRAISGM